MTKQAVRLNTGELRGLSIPVPRQVRPTSGRVREALLDSWQARLEGASVLDLFAGSGAVGLEALGRGAARLVGVEARPEVLAALGRGYAARAGDRARAVRAVLPDELLRSLGELRFDLVFADPPYEFDRFDELLAAAGALLAPGGELALEHSTRVTVPARAGDLELDRQRRYGESMLSFYRARGEEVDEP